MTTARDRDKKGLHFPILFRSLYFFFSPVILCCVFFFCPNLVVSLIFGFCCCCLYFIAPFNHSTDIENSLFFYFASATIFVSLYMSVFRCASSFCKNIFEILYDFIVIWHPVFCALYRKAFRTIFPLLSRLVLHFFVVFLGGGRGGGISTAAAFYLYLSNTVRPKHALCNNQHKIGFWKIYLLLSFLDVVVLHSLFIIQTKNVHTFCS